MRILFFISGFELGGAERQAIMLAEYMRSEGHEVFFWGLGKPGKVSMLCDEKKIAWNSIKINRNPFRVLFDIRKISPDVIIPFCTYPSLLCAISWRFTDVKVCLWNERDIGLSRDLQTMFPSAFKLSSCVVTNSEGGKNYIKKEFGSELDVRVINNGITLPLPKKTKEVWRKELDIKESTFVACIVANLTKVKNHSLLIHGWNDALKLSVVPKDSLLVLAGREDQMAESLRTQVANYGIQDKVKFLGQVDDVSGLLNVVDIGILSSFSEGQPNAILEYMYVGLSIIASDIPGNKEILQDTESCFFKTDSAKDLVEAFRVMRSFDRRYESGKKNASLCRQKYSPEKMFADYKALLDELISKKRKRVSFKTWFNIGLSVLTFIITSRKRKSKQ